MFSELWLEKKKKGCYCERTLFPYEGEAQLEQMAGVAVWMAGAEAGQEQWRHAANWGVDVDCGEHLVVLTQQAVENQQGDGGPRRVGIYDDVTEGTKILMNKEGNIY